MRQIKGAGSVRKRGRKFYFRVQRKGKEENILLKATTEEDAIAEARQYRRLIDAQNPEEMVSPLPGVQG